MAEQLIDRVARYLYDQCLVRANDNILIAVSGGPDSLALMSILAAISREMPLRLIVGHVNHCLRGNQSRDDASFVKEMASAAGLDCVVSQVNVARDKSRRQSLQMAARTLRLTALSDMAQTVGADKIALGHNRDDQAETVLFRIITGTSVTGVAGIRPIRDRLFIHPLLDVTRDEIEQYLNREGIAARRDPSNANLRYKRNRIRHNLLPVIEESYNANVKDALIRLSSLAAIDDDFIQQQVDAVWAQAVSVKRVPRYIVLDVEQCMHEHEAVMTRLVARAVFAAGGARVERKHIQSVCAMVKSRQPLSVWLPGRILAELHGSSLIITCQAAKGSWNVQQGSTIIPEMSIELLTDILCAPVQEFPPADGLVCYLDADKVNRELNVRTRMPGDRFYPLGGKGCKKLKSFMIDEKIPRGVRSLTLIVVDGDNIVWVVGHRIDHRYRVTDATRRVLRIEARPVDAAVNCVQDRNVIQ